MRNLAVSFIFIGFLFCASLCSAAYLIHLKDGREISTPEYWEEDGQIKIKQYGGVVGITKEDVLSIEEIQQTKTMVVKTPSQKKAEETDEKGEGPPIKEENKEKTAKPVEKKPAKEKNSLEKEFDSLKKRFERVDAMSKEEIHQFDKDLSLLRNKILAAGLGGAYADQMVEILNMGTKAEEVYKRKDQ